MVVSWMVSNAMNVLLLVVRQSQSKYHQVSNSLLFGKRDASFSGPLRIRGICFAGTFVLYISYSLPVKREADGGFQQELGAEGCRAWPRLCRFCSAEASLSASLSPRFLGELLMEAGFRKRTTVEAG